MEALLPYVGVERDRDGGSTLVHLFLAKVQSSHSLKAQWYYSSISNKLITFNLYVVFFGFLIFRR